MSNSVYKYDVIVIGAGIYGMYSAMKLSRQGKRVLVLEYDNAPFMRASYINQARVHNGYHYPRSISTALKSASYYKRFNNDFNFAINTSFAKIYSVSEKFSYASADNFKKFCHAANIPCEEMCSDKYFKTNMVESSFVCEEFAFDYAKIRDYFWEEIKSTNNVDFMFNARINKVYNTGKLYELTLDNSVVASNFVINATYASVNGVQELFGFDGFDTKYEICEMILCKTSDNIKNVGITVMDGPFFSVMPFGLPEKGLHSISAVHFTPHKTSFERLPRFSCQSVNTGCRPNSLANCNLCEAKPHTSWDYMSQLAKKYLQDDIEIFFEKSIFAIKPILKVSEVDDSRPTLVRKFSNNPTFISVLSGKINTVYDLDEVLV